MRSETDLSKIHRERTKMVIEDREQASLLVFSGIILFSWNYYTAVIHYTESFQRSRIPLSPSTAQSIPLKLTSSVFWAFTWVTRAFITSLLHSLFIWLANVLNVHPPERHSTVWISVAFHYTLPCVWLAVSQRTLLSVSVRVHTAISILLII